uniref:acid phosphatase n=1 Tax=Syphacia muris TaxID=451379 RepID=A0A158R4Y6_9BILA
MYGRVNCRRRLPCVATALLLLLQLLQLTAAKDDEKLQLVQVIWKNGQRNPSELCPKDSNREESFHQGFEYLTAEGMKQHFKLGKLLFNEYTKNNYLKEYYDPREIYIRSADTNRTILSANSNMVGMYYNGTQKSNTDYPGFPEWPEKLVPVSIHSDASNIDYESELAPCPYIHSILSDSYRNLTQTNSDFLTKITEKCGKNINLFNLDIVRRTYTAEKYYNLATHFSDDEYNKALDIENAMKLLKGESGKITDDLTELIQLRFGSLIKRILDHFSLKHSGTFNGMLNLMLQRISDENVRQNLIDSLFAMSMELYQLKNNSYIVKINTFNPDAVIAVPSIQFNFDELKADFSKFIPENIQTSCMKNAPTSTPPAPTASVSSPSTHPEITEDKLVFIQAFWRHGDRSPLSGCEKDTIKETNWHLGSGQLSPIGMEQHYHKGQLIYKRYVTEKQFLSKKYNAKEIYAHSTGFNRTIISAMCNLIGMYSSENNLVAGKDYPDIEGWPIGYVPIPVHNYDNVHDHMGDPNTPCPRQKYFVDLAENANEVVEYEKKNQDTLNKASELCGHNITLFSITRPLDANVIEGLYNYPQLFDETLQKKLQVMEGVAEKIKHGLLSKIYEHNSVQEGYDLRIEIPRTRGGSALWNVIDHMQLKHDSTVDAVLTTLGMKERVVPDGIPDYTATIMFELYKTPKNSYKVKVMYHRNPNTSLEWEDVTKFITECSDGESCSFDTFVNRSKPFHPEDINTLCQQIPSEQPTTAQPSTPTTSSSISHVSNIFLHIG